MLLAKQEEENREKEIFLLFEVVKNLTCRGV